MAGVVTTGEARDALHQIAKRFDEGDGDAAASDHESGVGGVNKWPEAA